MTHSITQSEFPGEAHQVAPTLPPLAMACILSRTSTLKEVWDVVRMVEAWPGVTITPDGSGLRLSLHGVALGHVRWNGRIDLPFGPEVADRLVIDDLVIPDPDRPQTQRVVFDIRTQADVGSALWLFRIAYLCMDSNGVRKGQL
ncbi:MAG TPA: luciferase family protein [Tepidisphaeraceae bacterium]|jgi:hypothetical protein|nr:luciferase family protein [Tepidisphaeraceae bacterium]